MFYKQGLFLIKCFRPSSFAGFKKRTRWKKIARLKLLCLTFLTKVYKKYYFFSCVKSYFEGTRLNSIFRPLTMGPILIGHIGSILYLKEPKRGKTTDFLSYLILSHMTTDIMMKAPKASKWPLCTIWICLLYVKGLFMQHQAQKIKSLSLQPCTQRTHRQAMHYVFILYILDEKQIRYILHTVGELKDLTLHRTIVVKLPLLRAV